MNIKKQLKEQRQKIDEKILSDGKQAYNELAGQYCVAETEPKQTRRINPTKWIAAVSCVVVVCLIVGLSVGLTLPSNPDTPPRPSEPSPPVYLEQYEVRVNSNIEEFNKDTNSTISFGSDYSISSIIRVDDSETSDKLFYLNEFEHNEELIWGELFVVINNNYHFINRHVGEVRNTKFNGCDMEYSFNKHLLDDILMCEFFGCITLADYKIYFSYEAPCESEDFGDNSIAEPSILEELLILK